jgi:ATP-dependent Lon protease
MPKRPVREKKRAGSMDSDLPPKRPNRKASEDVVWVVDTTLGPDSESESDSDSTYEDSEDHEELLTNLVKLQATLNERKTRSQRIEPNMLLTKKERAYFDALPMAKRLELNVLMERVKTFGVESEIPLKFRVLSLPISEYIKTIVLKKVSEIEDETGETYKLRNWVDGFLRIPFGKVIPLPVRLSDGKPKCSQFIRDSKAILDNAVYGMVNAKTQIMQVLAQWITNPSAVGNVIALQGPPGTGKTSIARNGIAQALHRPFEFFSLGGASDIATYTGHSYTYEGSMWGRIAEALMHSKCMNPILYFDELDKISGTAHGEEIASMLIHLTDRSQNSQFHDRYFSGIDFDVSQCLFVFSFNDVSQVNPILKDRMQVIQCSGYTAKDKESILKDYILPEMLERLRFDANDILVPHETAKFIISEYSKEEGVRNLIRNIESIVTRLNMLRIADEETMKSYKFYINVDFPVTLTESMVKTLLMDTQPKEPEAWRSMYN